MDAVVTTLIGAAPQLGVAGILLALLGLVIRWGSQDRSDNRAQMGELTARHAVELARINADHDAELGELRTEIRGLRVQLEEVNRKLDEERDRRRKAEDVRRPGEDPAMGRLQQGDQPWLG